MSGGARTLSVVMIARDAAATLADALASVREMADELLVVDTGSLDDTRRIAAAAGARVTVWNWTNDFSAARNFAREQATGDWILWLDASEKLNSASATALRQFVLNDAAADKAYLLNIVLPRAVDEPVGQQIARPRLAPNQPDVRFTGRVDERLLVPGNFTLETLPWTIERSPRDNEPAVRIAKARRNLAIVEQEIKALGQSPERLVVLGESLTSLGESAGAAASFQTVLTIAQPGSVAMRAAYYGLLALASEELAWRQQQIGICSQALAHFPLDAQLLCALGDFLQAEERFDLSARAFRAAYEHGEIEPALWHVPNVREVAGIALAIVHQLHEDDAASAVLEEMLARDAASARARRHLIDLHIKHDRRKEALAEFDRAGRDLPQREAMRSAIRGACLAARKNWVPALAYLQTAHAGGCRDSLCLRWLAVALIANEEFEAAAPVVEQWLAVEPRNIEARKYAAALAAGTPEALIATPTAPIVSPAVPPIWPPVLPQTSEKRVIRLDPPAIFAPNPGLLDPLPLMPRVRESAARKRAFSFVGPAKA